MEELKCDKCGAVYTDEESIQTAKDFQSRWDDQCQTDGVEPRGLLPCPNIACEGELILQEV